MYRRLAEKVAERELPLEGHYAEGAYRSQRACEVADAEVAICRELMGWA
jgi:hypothetical protein